MGSRTIPSRGSIPGRKPPKGLGDVLGETGNLLGGLLGGLGKTVESIQNLNLEDIDLAAKHGGTVQTGIKGHILGRPIGGGTQFDVKGKKGEKGKVEVQEPEMDPIEEDEKSFIVRGYMAGVDAKDITCEVEENGSVLKISAQGRKNYQKKVNFSSPVNEDINWTHKNGVLEVTLIKKRPK